MKIMYVVYTGGFLNRSLLGWDTIIRVHLVKLDKMLEVTSKQGKHFCFNLVFEKINFY